MQNSRNEGRLGFERKISAADFSYAMEQRGALRSLPQ
jgi:hypothetical protein